MDKNDAKVLVGLPNTIINFGVTNSPHSSTSTRQLEENGFGGMETPKTDRNPF